MARDPTTLDLFVTHRGELVNYASRIVGDHAHAEDVVQEAYLRFDTAAGAQPLGQPLMYLYRVVRNLSVDVRRRLVRDNSRFPPGLDAAIADVREDRPSPEAEVIARRELQVMTQAMAELPERTRIALEMHRFGGCSFREIATHLGISVGLAHALVVQALDHCRRRLCHDR